MSTSTAPTTFYGGQASSLGTVSKLPITSWTQFVKDILSHPQRLNVTREQYHKLPDKERQQAKRVAYVTPATFTTTKAQRITANAKDIVLIALDIDDPKQARPFVNDPDSMKTMLHPYAFAAYTTATSTAENPKLRIFVPAQHIPVSLYPAAVAIVADLLDLPMVTKESKVAVQPMYLPTVFREEDVAESTPMLIALTSGQSITKAQCSIGPDRTHAPTAGKSDSNSSSSEIEYLKSPLDNTTLEEVESALSTISPDVDRQEWLRMAAALRHQFPKDDDGAYDLFDRWSAKGEKYDGKKDTKKMWESLRSTPRGRDPVTVRTLFAKAKLGGWAGSTKGYRETMLWLVDPDRTDEDLKDVGPGRIARTLNLSATNRDILIQELVRLLRKRSIIVGLPAMRKTVRKMEALDSRTKTNGDEAKFPKWAQGLMYVSDCNEFFHRLGGNRYTPEALDNVYGLHLMAPDAEGGRPAIRPRDYLLNTLQISRVNNYRYDPSHPESAILHDGAARFVNLYLPTYPEPDDDDADAAGEILTDHLKNLISETDYRRTLLDFMAYCVKSPGEKIRWAVLLQGVQGCGKTALAEVMRAVLGQTNVTLMDAGQLFSQFNSWAMGAQLVVMEEVRVVGHNRHDVMNRLKPCISNNSVMINDKGRKLQQVPNQTNYMMFTNHHDSLAVGEDDRRYFVVESALQTKAEVRELGSDYFTKLFNCIENRAAGLRAFLEAHKLHPLFDPDDRAPATSYLKGLHEASSTPLSASIREALRSTEALVRRDLVSSRSLRTVLETEHGVRNLNGQLLSSALREMHYVDLGKHRVCGSEHWLWAPRKRWVAPDLAAEEARRRVQGKSAATKGGHLL